jgi:hypothetical protein
MDRLPTIRPFDNVLIKNGTYIYYKFRGLHQAKKEEQDPVFFQIARNILNGSDTKIENLEHKESEIMKVSKYLIQKKNDLDVTEPGYSYETTRQFHFTMMDLAFSTKKEYVSKKKEKKDYSYILQEKNFHEMFFERVHDSQKSNEIKRK